MLQTGRFSAVWRGTLQQRPVAIKAFVAGAAGRFAAERAVHGLPLMEHDNVARLLGTRGAGPRARGGLLVLQLYPAVSGSEGWARGAGGCGRVARGGARACAWAAGVAHVCARDAHAGCAVPVPAPDGGVPLQAEGGRWVRARGVGGGGAAPCPHACLHACPQGSLRHFLEQHVGTWAGSVRLALSLARGLAFLHQELWRDGECGHSCAEFARPLRGCPPPHPVTPPPNPTSQACTSPAWCTGT